MKTCVKVLIMLLVPALGCPGAHIVEEFDDPDETIGEVDGGVDGGDIYECPSDDTVVCDECPTCPEPDETTCPEPVVCDDPVIPDAPPCDLGWVCKKIKVRKFVKLICVCGKLH